MRYLRRGTAPESPADRDSFVLKSRDNLLGYIGLNKSSIIDVETKAKVVKFLLVDVKRDLEELKAGLIDLGGHL
jgi:hypothetical protein